MKGATRTEQRINLDDEPLVITPADYRQLTDASTAQSGGI
jgi:hypothetical protein